ncbi:hypothetical protein ACQ4LE_010555, partial [Meloidogyne hapla]
MGVWKGRMMGNTWISDKDPLLLDFKNISDEVNVCNKQLVISNQGFAAEGLKQRSKRSRDSIVTTSQLHSELSYLDWEIKESLEFSFTHSVKSICEYIEENRRWAISALFSDPTTFARTIFSNPNLHAKRVSSTVLKVWPCIPLERDAFEFVQLNKINMKIQECFGKIPIKFRTTGKEIHAFLDQNTMEIIPMARKGPCSEYRYQIVQFGKEIMMVDQLTAQTKKMNVKQLTNLTLNPIEIPAIQHHSFHNLILTNVTDIISHAFVSNTIKLSQITY